MKKMRWQILIVVLALAAIGVLLITQQPALLPTAPEVQPATGGIYTEGLVGSLGRLNPVLDFYNPADHDVDRLIYSSLVHFDSRGLPVLDLAESMGISEDGKVYNFSLREDAQWHDGKPVTSEDVAFTIELLRSDELPIPDDVRALWQNLVVNILDGHTLQFRLPEPYAPFMDYLAFGILPRHLLEDLSPQELVDARFNLQPVGSGPFRFERTLVEDGKIVGLVLEAFEDYPAGPPFIEQFAFRYYPDSKSALAAYQGGDVQGISRVYPDSLTGALQEAQLNFYTSLLPQQTLILLNLNDPQAPFFQDAVIRRALLMGINRQRIIDTNFGGQAVIADGPIFPGSWAYYSGIERLNYDPEAAIDLLKQAGYTIPAAGGNVRANEEGKLLAFPLLYPDEPQFQPIAEAIAKDWTKLGVEVELQALPYEELVSQHLEPRDYKAALVDLNLSRSPDPDPYPFWHQAQVTGGQNYSQWDDRQASEYLEQARVILDTAERERLYKNFQVRFTAEMPALPLLYPVSTYAIADQVQGVSVGPLFDTSDRFATASKWFLLAELTTETAITPTTP